MAVPQTTNTNDITSVIATLASRQSNRPVGPPMSTSVSYQAQRTPSPNEHIPATHTAV